MSIDINKAQQLFKRFEICDDLTERTKMCLLLQQLCIDEEQPSAGYAAISIGYQVRHDLFLQLLAEYLEIPYTSDVSICYIESLLADATNIQSKDLESHILYTPDLVTISDGCLYIIDAKVQAFTHMQAENTYRKYEDAFSPVATKYGVELKVLIVTLNPEVTNIYCVPQPMLKFETEGVAPLVSHAQRIIADEVETLTHNCRELRDKYQNNNIFNRVRMHFDNQKYHEFLPWIDIPDTALDCYIENDDSWKALEERMSAEQFESLKNDINHYNILDKSSEDYYNRRTRSILKRYDQQNKTYINNLYDKSITMCQNPEQADYLQPTEESLNKAFTLKEIQMVNDFECISTLTDCKPSQHFTWVPSESKTKKLIDMKGEENAMKLGRLMACIKEASINSAVTIRDDTLKNGACALLKSLQQSCDISLRIEEYASTIKTLKESNTNTHITFDTGETDIKISKNYSFKIKPGFSKENAKIWAKIGKGYKKPKNMSEIELEELIEKRPKILNVQDDCLKDKALKKWSNLRNSLSEPIDQSLTSLHQYDHFHDAKTLEFTNEVSTPYINDALNSTASAILKDTSLLFKNMLATSHISSRDSYKFYFSKNINVCFVVLPCDSILKANSSIVYCCISIVDYLEEFYKYNLEDNLAYACQSRFTDPITETTAHKWLIVSRPYRLDKTRLGHLFRSYENFILQFSIQTYLLTCSLSKDHIYTKDEKNEWYKEAIALSYFSAVNITKSITSIVDPGRYMVNNSLADFSNNFQYIVEKFDPRPKTLFSLIMYNRLKEGCKRINYECSKIRMKKIQFREDDMLNVGIESCEIKAIYNHYLTCAGISDVIIESQTFFYNCMKELHSQTQNMIKLYRVPLELELNYRNEYKKLKESKKLNNFFTGQASISINYDTLVGALVKNYTAFGHGLLGLRKDIEMREGFNKPPGLIRTLSSSKSCVRHRRSTEDIVMANELSQIIDIEDIIKRSKYIKAFNQKYKTCYRADENELGITLTKKDVDRHLVQFKIQDYLSVESTRVFDELCNILDNKLEEIKQVVNPIILNKIETVNDIKTYHLFLWAILDLESDLHFTVFQKGQRTYNDREIYQGSYKNKLAMYYFEHIYKYFCGIHPEEMISEGGDRKVFKMNQVRKHDYRRMRDLRMQEIKRNKEMHEAAIQNALKKQEETETQSIAQKLLSSLSSSSEKIDPRLEQIRQELRKICLDKEDQPKKAKEEPCTSKSTKRTVEIKQDTSLIRITNTELYHQGASFEPVEYINPINLFEINADQSKWSARDLTDKFIIMVSLNPALYPSEKKTLILFLLKYMRKRLIITDDTMATLLNFKNLRAPTQSDDPFQILLKNYSRNYCRITQNWLQGNFNYSSSFIHVTCMTAFKDRLKLLPADDRFGCLEINSSSLVHSDDNNTSILIQIDKQGFLNKLFNIGLAGWFLISIFRDTMEDFCVHLNDKKTYISRIIKEFISQVVVAGEPCPTWQRDILPILGNATFQSSMEDIYSLSSHLQTAICHGAPPSIITIAKSIIHSCVYSMYLQGYEMHNDPVKVFNIKRSWLPIQLGGIIKVPSHILALYGPASNDPWKLKTLLNKALRKREHIIPNFNISIDIPKKIELLQEDDLLDLEPSEKFFLKFLVLFHPCFHLEEETEQDLEILDPECLRPSVLLRPRSFVTGKYLERFYTKRLFTSMVDSNEINTFILENPETTFSKPQTNDCYSRWSALKFKNVNFVQSLSLQSKSALLIDKIIHSKQNLIRASFIDDYLTNQNYEIQFGENTMIQGHLTYIEAYEKINTLITNMQLDINIVKDVCKSVLLSNKFLQLLLELDDNISYESSVKNTSNYISKFKSVYHTQDIINPPTKIIKAFLYPFRNLEDTELKMKSYLNTEINFLAYYLERTNYYKTYKTIFKDTYTNKTNANKDQLKSALDSLLNKYNIETLVRVISKMNSQAFSYFLMYNYKSRLMILKEYCPNPSRFLPILVGSHIKDNQFIYINILTNFVQRKNIELCSVINITPALSHLIDVFYSYFNFVEACVNPACRVSVMKTTLRHLTYKNINVCQGILNNTENIMMSDKRLCMIFMHKYGIQLTERQKDFCSSLVNTTRSINCEWYKAHIDRSHHIGPFSACYFTKNIQVKVSGTNKLIEKFMIELNDLAFLDSQEGNLTLQNILKRISNDLELDSNFFRTLTESKYLLPWRLYLRDDRKSLLFITKRYQRGMISGRVREICPVQFNITESANLPIYTIDDVELIFKDDEEAQIYKNDEDVKTIVKLLVGPRLKLCIKRKMYKRLTNANFDIQIYFCSLNWNRFINCNTLLSCLDSGRYEINLTEIYRCIADLKEEIKENSKVFHIPFYNMHQDFFSEETTAFSYDTSDLDVTDYSGTVTSIASLPFGIPIPFANRIQSNISNLDLLFRGLTLCRRYTKIPRDRYNSMILYPVEGFEETCAVICAAFDLMKNLLSNGTRSGMYVLYYTCLYYCDRHGKYPILKEKFTNYLKKYGYTTLGTNFYENDRLLELTKEIITLYTIVDKNESSYEYRIILSQFAENIAKYSIEKIQTLTRLQQERDQTELLIERHEDL
nr:MAG: RNA-dependent RNA polymerase [Wenzhou rodent bunyavirus 1]